MLKDSFFDYLMNLSCLSAKLIFYDKKYELNC